jgi:hypothetical protein
LSEYRASLSRRLVVVVAPCSTVAATGGLVSEFQAADAGREDVSSVCAPRVTGAHRIRVSNVLAMLFPIRSSHDPQQVPDGPDGTDVHIHTVE